MVCPDGGRFYTEYLMLPLGFMAALPIVVEILPKLRTMSALVLVVAFCFFRIAIIYHTHIDYTRRLDMYQDYFNYIQKNKLSGVLVDEKLIDQKKAIMTWGSGYESILISALKSPDSCRVVQIDADITHYKWALDLDTSLVTIYGVWGRSHLPQRYFRPSGSGYHILTKQP